MEDHDIKMTKPKENTSLELLLKTHQDVSGINFDEIWNEGIFIFDANVLLDIYRLPESARNDLIKVLSHEKFKDRIWIAQQVLIEFLYNRIEVINEQKGKYETVRGLLNECKGDYEAIFKKLTTDLGKLKIKKRHSSIDPDEFITQANIENGISFIDKFIEKLSTLEEKQSDVNTDDKIKPIILELFSGKIGAGFDNEQLAEIYKEGEKRYKKQIPPGFKDDGKDGSYIVGEQEYIRKYGDLLLWQEIIEKAKSDNLKHAVLITGDSKEDWWFKKGGKNLGPRKELLNEIYHRAPNLKTFYLYETSIFLSRARDIFNVNVKDSTISETKNLTKIERNNRSHITTSEYDNIDLKTLIELFASEDLRYRLRISAQVRALPEFRCNLYDLVTAVSEIMHNMDYHGDDGQCTVRAKIGTDNIIITFKNTKPDYEENSKSVEPFDVMGHRVLEKGTGLAKAYNALNKQNIKMRVISGARSFIVRIYIPKPYFIGSIPESEWQSNNFNINNSDA